MWLRRRPLRSFCDLCDSFPEHPNPLCLASADHTAGASPPREPCAPSRTPQIYLRTYNRQLLPPLQFCARRSVARRARIGENPSGTLSEGIGASAGEGARATGRSPAPPGVNPPPPTPRRARASLPPPSLRSAHAPHVGRIPGPAAAPRRPPNPSRSRAPPPAPQTRFETTPERLPVLGSSLLHCLKETPS